MTEPEAPAADTTESEAPANETHEMSCVFRNYQPDAVTDVTITHTSKNISTTSHTWERVERDEEVSGLTVKFETGLFPSHDYWHISLVDSGGTRRTCKDNFYCNLTSTDAHSGKPVILHTTADRGHFKVTPPRSSECIVDID